MLPPSRERVPEHTEERVNEWIRQRMEDNIKLYATAGKEFIDRRINELDREWNIERTLEANASALALTGLILGVTVSRKWLVLPAIVAGFLFQHALQGWCPPVPVLRRLGFRTPYEVDYERYALKALRGDFKEIGESSDADKVLGAVAE